MTKRRVPLLLEKRRKPYPTVLLRSEGWSPLTSGKKGYKPHIEKGKRRRESSDRQRKLREQKKTA